MKLYAWILALVAFASTSVSIANSQDLTVFNGRILDDETGEGIQSATVRLADEPKGTYSKAGGYYRFPLPTVKHKVVIRFVGYEDLNVVFDPQKPEVNYRLKLNKKTKTITVNAGLSATDIIRYAIQRKQVNASRIKTIEQTLYTKTRFDVSADGLAAPDIEEAEHSIAENFSRIYERRDTPRAKHVVVLQRRQTKNISSALNNAAFDDFFDFTEDEIKIFNTTLVTPLADNALGEYKYTLTNKSELSGKMIYEISFEPKSRVFPGLEGTMSIVDGTYQVVSAKFKPTDQTAFFLLKGLTYEQRYEEYNDSIWVPMYQAVTAYGAANILVGVIGVGGGIKAETHVTEIKVNHIIPDSLLKPAVKIQSSTDVDVANGAVTVTSTQTRPYTTVAKDADSAKPEFWEKHSFAEPTIEEREIYRKLDSLVPIRDKERAKKSSSPESASSTTGARAGWFTLLSFGDYALGVGPLLDNNSVMGWAYGGQVVLDLPRSIVTADALFGENDTKAGQVRAKTRLYGDSIYSIDLDGSVFSKISTVQPSADLLGRFDEVNLTNLIYGGYYDYFRQEGFDVGALIKRNAWSLSLLYTDSRYRNDSLISPPDRTSVLATAGAYKTADIRLAYSEPTIWESMLGVTNPVYGSVNFMTGIDDASSVQFASIDGRLGFNIPTFDVGYDPMLLNVELIVGKQDSYTPRQFQFNLMRRFPVLGRSSDLFTPPINAFAGSEYGGVVAQHNFTDIWWRFIGLPTYNGRGLDLILRGASVRMDQKGQPVVKNVVYDGTGGWYSEAGFALARIPSYISDFLFL